MSNTIKVSGLPEVVSKDMVLLYFENQKRSGGGYIKNCNFVINKGKAMITFEDSAGWDYLTLIKLYKLGCAKSLLQAVGIKFRTKGI